MMKKTNTNETNQNNLNDQDLNYYSIPHNLPHSHKKTYAEALNNLQEIDYDEFINEDELNDENEIIDEDKLNDENVLNNLHEIYEDDKNKLYNQDEDELFL